MEMFILQSLLLMAIAYILGCILGCLLHQLMGADDTVTSSTGAAATAGAGVVAAAAAAMPEPKPEPVARAAAPVPPKPKPTPKPKKALPAAAPVVADDLKRIRGIGRQNEARLNSIGVERFQQIASWTVKDQREIGERLSFPGRIEREEWVKQAKALAKGQETEFSKRVAKGSVATSVGKGTVGEMGKKPSVMKAEPAVGADNLTLIDGVGNAIEKKLFALGIYTFKQIASWNVENEIWVSNEIGFPGRSQRENWVADAARLDRGEMTEHARKVERGQIKTSRKS